MPEGNPWPRVSVVTPSFNQAPFLEATLRSVLLQGYPNLEYIVVDGGSTDGSVEILRRYEEWLHSWVSESDRGQSDAVNKGFARATGEILGWVNSDDLYEPNTLARVARFFAETPECDLVYGRGSYVDERGDTMGPCHWIRTFDRRLLLTFNFILQPAAFWRRSLWEQTGDLDVAYHWAMDWDWLIRATAYGRAQHIPVELARWRVRPGIKTAAGGERRRAEVAAISRRHGGFWQPTHLVYLWDRAAWRLARRIGTGRAFRIIKRATSPLGWLLKERAWKNRYLD
jgi:glycosyltransferase involved in cell wall biosynthesis